MEISGVTITIRHVRNHYFTFIPVSPADCGPKFPPGSSYAGPLRREYRKEGAGADHLVNVGSRFRASCNPSAGHQHFCPSP